MKLINPKHQQKELQRKEGIEGVMNEGLTVTDTIKKLRRFTEVKLIELNVFNNDSYYQNGFMEPYAKLEDGSAFVQRREQDFGSSSLNMKESIIYVLNRDDEAIVCVTPLIELVYKKDKK